MFLDIGVGILSAIFVSYFFGVSIDWPLLFGGVLFALGPDADFLLHFFKHGINRDDYKHRNVIHFPLLYLPIGLLVISLLGGEAWGLLFVIASLGHFLHDSIAIGWGIKWLYPFSNKNFVFLYHYSTKQKRGLRKMVLALDGNQLTEVVEEHWNGDWLRDIYYHWHPIAVVEFGVFLFSFLALYLYVK